MSGIWEQVEAHLGQRSERRLLRSRRVVEAVDAVHVRIDGRAYVNFASNDYLGLTHHPRVMSAVKQAVEQYGAGAGAAGLISGYGPVHRSAEQAIARWKGTEAAVLLPSGYQANAAAIQTLAAMGELAGGGVRFLLDKLAHASLIDAVRSTGATFRVFPHNGMAKLARLLGEAPAGQLQVVVTESIFSMDGDACDLAALAALKREHGFLLLLDEAHGTGVYGPGGSGYAAERGLQAAVDISIATLSKAMGSQGGAVCGSRRFCDLLLNHGRAYIYSTSVPAHLAAAAQAAIEVMGDEPDRQQRVRRLAGRVRAALGQAGRGQAGQGQAGQGQAGQGQAGQAQGGTAAPGLADSPIVPVIVADERQALEGAEQLADRGILVVAVRPPTVPVGGSRLRVTVSSAHSDDEVDQLIGALGAIRK